MPMTKTFWYDERLVQSTLRFLMTEKQATAEGLAVHLGIDPVDALSMLRELADTGRVADVTSFADRQIDRRIWVSGETPLNIVEEEKAG